jgi:hypothetical protein
MLRAKQYVAGMLAEAEGNQVELSDGAGSVSDKNGEFVSGSAARRACLSISMSR